MPLSHLYTKIEITERCFPVVFCGIGVWLMFIDHVFEAIPAYMNGGGFSEKTWSAVFGGLGIFQLLATNYGSRRMRRFALFLTSLISIVWAIILCASFNKGFGQIVYSAAAVMSLWTFIRARK